MDGRTPAPPAIELRGLSKRFGEVIANADISLSVRAGSIHAIVGENGAGKSTAMKMLYGMFKPDAGEIVLDGVVRHWRSPRDAIQAGVGMVHQHFMLAGPYSALENVVLGVEERYSRLRFLPRALRPFNRQQVRQKLERLSEAYGFSVPWNQPIEAISVGVQQRIEILKLLYREARVLILDEPTAVLTPQETLELFSNLRKLAAEGKTILIITHKLKEVMAVSDRVSIFRAGRVVAEVETKDTHAAQLAELMVGRKVCLMVEPPPAPRPGATVLEIKDLELKTGSSVSLSIRSGEILGVAGVEGNGQSELLRALLHPEDFYKAKTPSSIHCLGRETLGKHAWASSRQIKELGVGFVPEDRHHEALLLARPIRESFLLGLHRRAPYARAGWLQGSVIDSRAMRLFEEYDVRPRSLEILASGMSGGNQQKVVVARELSIEPKLLIVAQPTRGVDVGAIEFIHRKILEARARGAGVLLVSSELDEVLALSDRVMVLFGGRVTGEFDRESADERKIGLCMGGGHA